MNVAVINTYDAKDVSKWSGIPYHLSLLFDELFGDQVSYIKVPVKKRSIKSYLLGFYYNTIRRKRYYTWADELFLIDNKAIVESIIFRRYDLVITFEFYMVPLLKRKANTVIYWNDATFANLNGFYPGYSNFSNYSLAAASKIQKIALDLSDIIIYSSDWAVQSAISDYNIDRQKVHKILFASNLKSSLQESNLTQFLDQRDKKVVKLLFLAVDWERKGGDDAIAVLNNLNDMGIEAILYIVGTNIPTRHKENKHIRALGFIDKKSSDGEPKLLALFKECSYLILPSRSDLTPVVFSEASSFALPVITTNVGGITSVIKNGVNGFHFPVHAFVRESTEYIAATLPQSAQYDKLCRSTYAYYQNNLSWNQVKNQFSKILNEIPDLNIQKIQSD
jgi:glycosyltransferase involved in cell wall biosynthesis